MNFGEDIIQLITRCLSLFSVEFPFFGYGVPDFPPCPVVEMLRLPKGQNKGHVAHGSRSELEVVRDWLSEKLEC
jgi:hypothetical protein